MFRVGFGYDVHRLAEGESLIIGGIALVHHKGTVGHSDGDVLIHAIIDALLGAANLRDIGYHFPDNQSEYKDIDSKVLLENSLQLIRQKGYAIGNIDSTICLQRPKIKAHIPDMQQCLAEVMAIAPENIAIKATTTERLGFVGTEDGISAYAVALLHKV